MHADGDGPRVAVVGAGITGLAVTHALRTRGIEVHTFEAAARPGGVIRSRRVNGRVLEYGPQRLRLSGVLDDLVDDLDLRDRLVRAPSSLPLYVVLDGTLCEVPRSPGAFLRTDALSLRGKLRVLGEPLTRPAAPTETAGDLLARKFGREAYRNVIAPLLGGIYATDPARMPARHAISPLLSLERRHRRLLFAALRRLGRRSDTPPIVSFEDGLATLTDALATRHRESIAFDTAVQSITRTGASDFEVRTNDRTVDADAVVVTVEAPEAAHLLSGLPDANVGPLEELRYNPLAIVHLEATGRRRGLGYQIPHEEGFRTRGVTWHDALFERDGVCTAFLGGGWDPTIVETSPEQLGEIASEEFTRVTGEAAEVLDVTVLPRAIPAHDETWWGMDALAVPHGVWLATNYTGRIGVPGRLREATRIAAALADG